MWKRLKMVLQNWKKDTQVSGWYTIVNTGQDFTQTRMFNCRIMRWASTASQQASMGVTVTWFTSWSWVNKTMMLEEQHIGTYEQRNSLKDVDKNSALLRLCVFSVLDSTFKKKTKQNQNYSRRPRIGPWKAHWMQNLQEKLGKSRLINPPTPPKKTQNKH